MKFNYTIRKDGMLQKKVNIGGKTKVIYSKSPKELEKKYIELLHLRNTGGFFANDTITLNEWSKYWLDTYKSNVSYATKEMYSSAFNYILPELGIVRLNTLSEAKIMTLINSLQDRPRTQQIVLLTLRQCLNKAVDHEYIDKNPTRNIKLQRYKAKEKEVIDFDLIKRIKELSEKDIDFQELYFMIYTGLRCEELVALDKNSVQGNYLVIDKAMDLKSNTLKHTKNNEIRKIPILDNIQPIIEQKSAQNLLWRSET